MKRIVRLTENDLSRIVRRVINEESEMFDDPCQNEIDNLSKLIGGKLPSFGGKLPSSCMGADMNNECINEILNMAGPFSYPGEELRLLDAITKLGECKLENSDNYDFEDDEF